MSILRKKCGTANIIEDGPDTSINANDFDSDVMDTMENIEDSFGENSNLSAISTEQANSNVNIVYFLFIFTHQSHSNCSAFRHLRKQCVIHSRLSGHQHHFPIALFRHHQHHVGQNNQH